MATMSQEEETAPVRRRLLTAALRMLEDSGPEALQARKLAAEVGASTMAVYTHFGGMPQLLEEAMREGFVRLSEQLARAEESGDPIADLLTMGLAYREFALANPQLYRLMFGLTTPGTRRAKERDLTVERTPTELAEGATAFDFLVNVATRAAESGRIHQDDRIALAGQIWSLTHGYVLLEIAGVFGHDGHGVLRVFAPLIVNLLVGMGDQREAVERSMAKVNAAN